MKPFSNSSKGARLPHTWRPRYTDLALRLGTVFSRIYLRRSRQVEEALWAERREAAVVAPLEVANRSGSLWDESGSTGAAQDIALSLLRDGAKPR
jgi:hypothetical protein